MSPFPYPIRTECPPGACVCDRDALLSEPNADLRVMRLTREEEKRCTAWKTSAAWTTCAGCRPAWKNSWAFA